MREQTPPANCATLDTDPVCKVRPAIWDDTHDAPNLRCYHQRERFGFDLLYETSRYVDGLTKTMLPLQSTPGVSVINPLFDPGNSGKAPRDPSLVFLTGIVGVPWQDIADEASLNGPGLTYLTAKELAAKGRWQLLLGTPKPGLGKPPVLPSDPFMIETTEPRSGMNPIAQVSISSADSLDPHANAINGHEQHIPQLNDLQYACTFPQAPRICTPQNAASCDCSPRANGDSSGVLSANSPLCQGGPNINTQTSAKAYPGVRELTVLKDFGENAIVASICPKFTAAVDPTHPAADPNYGYNPAVGAIIDRLTIALQGKCLPRRLDVDERGQVLCRVVEAQPHECNCGIGGRTEADPMISAAVRAQLKANGSCGDPRQAPCSDWCLGEIKQQDAAHLEACQSNSADVPAGFCYVDEHAKRGDGVNEAQAIDEQLNRCPSNQRQLLRFVDADPAHRTPAQGATAFIACVGAPIVSVERSP